MNFQLNKLRDGFVRVSCLAVLAALCDVAPAELSADKSQATLGIQRIYRGSILRFGITENLANFNNTPDIGVNFSIARLFASSREKAAQGSRP